MKHYWIKENTKHLLPQYGIKYAHQDHSDWLIGYIERIEPDKEITLMDGESIGIWLQVKPSIESTEFKEDHYWPIALLPFMNHWKECE